MNTPTSDPLRLPSIARTGLSAVLLCLGALPVMAVVTQRWVSVELHSAELGAATPPLVMLSLAVAYALVVAALLHGRTLRRAARARRVKASQAQAERLRTLSLLEAIARCTTELIVAKDMDGRYTFYNHASAMMFGKSADQILGRTNSDIFGPAIGARLTEADQSVLRALQPLVYDDAVPTPHGVVTLQYTKSPLQDSSGQLIGLLIVARDVTENRRLQADLTEHRAQLESEVATRTLELTVANEAMERTARFNRTVIDALPGRVAYFDANRRCRFANRLYAAWFGRSVESIIGLTAPEIAGPHHERIRGPLLAAFSGQAQCYERETVMPDGTLHYQQVHIVPDSGVQGDVHGALLMAFDITALKHTEQALTRSNGALEASRDQAEAANRAKSVFLATMSHEIRTPLNAVIGLTHLMAMDAGDARQRTRLAQVDTAAQHLLRILNDILDLSKIEAGKLQLENRAFSLHAVVRQATELLEASVQRKGLAMSVVADPLPGGVSGDTMRLSQMLINLLSNAIKFTDSGAIRLAVRVAATEVQRVQMRFEVEDTGVGVAPERRAALFNSFEQGDTSTTRRHGGTGLGLALTRQLAEAMGGQAGYRANAQQGSTFWFTVWLATAPPASADALRATPAALPASASSPAAVPAAPRSGCAGPGVDDALAQLRQHHGGQRVLLAEDNPVHREIARELLQLAGLQVEWAEGGEHAMRAAASGAFDAVLADLETAQRVASASAPAPHARGRHTPVIAMAGDAQAAALSSGLVDWLVKPVDPATLYGKLLRWLPAAQQA